MVLSYLDSKSLRPRDAGALEDSGKGDGGVSHEEGLALLRTCWDLACDRGEQAWSHKNHHDIAIKIFASYASIYLYSP